MHRIQQLPPTSVSNKIAQPATPNGTAQPMVLRAPGMPDTPLFDKPILAAGEQVKSHLVSVSSLQTASVSSTEQLTPPVMVPPLARPSEGVSEISEVSTVPKFSLSDGIPPAFDTSSSYDGSTTALNTGLGRHFSITLQTGELMTRSMGNIKSGILLCEQSSQICIALSVQGFANAKPICC